MMRYAAPLAAIVAALFVGGIWWMSQGGGQQTAFAQCGATQIAGDGNQIGGPFELVNAEGETVTDSDVITEPSILYFGYTFCPDVCPLDTARNAEAVDVLAEQGLSVTPVFISIDPERDTPEIVGDFAYNLHE
ncbi:MAG: SCO family protein, partial [Pseudomonadota bacterium]